MADATTVGDDLVPKEFSMILTPQSQLRIWLVQTLGGMGGKAKRQTVLQAMEETFHDQLTDADWNSPAKRPFESNWANRTSFERDTMVKEGLLQPVELAGYGQWVLSEDGWALYRRLEVGR